DQVALDVQRGERRLTVRVNVAERDAEMGRLADLVSPQNAIQEIGVLGVDLTPAIRDALQDLRGDKGIVVALVAVGTPYSQQGRLAQGDVIYAVNGKPVDGVENLKKTLAALPQNAPFVLHVEREGI